MLVIVVDAFSKWIEVFPTQHSPSSGTTKSKLRTLFVTFDLPVILVSDNGPAFVDAEFKDVVHKMALAISIPRHITRLQVIWLTEQLRQLRKAPLSKQ